MSADEAQRLSESLLVLRAQAGDRQAFRELVTLYDARLMYYVRRLVRTQQDCQDVLQETWLQVFRGLSRIQSPQAFRVWLYRIAYRRAITARRRTEEVPKNEQFSNAETIDSWNELALLENAELVHRALERLSAAHREVLTLRFLEEMDVKEIAEVIGCNEGTAKSRLHYAKQALRSLLEDDDHEPE